ncbi:MAG: RidA family protein [Candidatus Tectomicrobia bacterium]|nr:RidA family protein [Candidatus Tectomicrobia bacterium]
MTPEEKIKAMGLGLPEAPKPLGSYIPVVQTGNLLFIAGQLPTIQGKLQHVGKLGKEVTVEEGAQDAKICALNALSIVKGQIGELSRVKRIVRLSGFIRSAEGFTDQPKVMNGASDFLGELFGEMGRHARVAIGVNELPLGAPVELEMIVEVEN